jgi:hypothetical protein
MSAGKARSVVEFERTVTALAGIYYRRDRGILTGRNSSSTDDYVDALVKRARALLRAELDDENSPLYAELDRRPKLAAKWDRLERRYYGLPA